MEDEDAAEGGERSSGAGSLEIGALSAPHRALPMVVFAAPDLAFPMAALAMPAVALQAPGAQSAVVGLDGLTLALAVGAFLVIEVLLLASVVRLWRAARAQPRRRATTVRWGWELFWTVLPARGCWPSPS